ARQETRLVAIINTTRARRNRFQRRQFDREFSDEKFARVMFANALLLADCNPVSVDHWRNAQLLVIERATCRLVVWEVGLAQNVAEIIVLVRTVKNVPDIAIEPRLVIRIPLEPPRAPMNQGRCVCRRNVLWVVECP